MNLSENVVKTKICPKCGATFTCNSGTGNCWCNSNVISPENIKLLKEKYSNCLCPECLAAFSEKVNNTSCDK